MESHGVKCMTRNYFYGCNGVILVCDQGKLTTLQDLIGWIKAVNENSGTSSPVFTLWCNVVDSYSGVEVTDELMEAFAKEHGVRLYTRLADAGEVVGSYRKLVESMHLSWALSGQDDDASRGGRALGTLHPLPPIPGDQAKQCVSLTRDDDRDNRWCHCS